MPVNLKAKLKGNEAHCYSFELADSIFKFSRNSLESSATWKFVSQEAGAIFCVIAKPCLPVATDHSSWPDGLPTFNGNAVCHEGPHTGNENAPQQLWHLATSDGNLNAFKAIAPYTVSVAYFCAPMVDKY